MTKCVSRLYPNDEPDYFYACDLEMLHDGKHHDNDTGREWGDE